MSNPYRRVSEARIRELGRSLLRQGEVYREWHCADCAPGCRCPPELMRRYAGVPCLPLGIGTRWASNGIEPDAMRVDRCLACGAEWATQDPVRVAGGLRGRPFVGPFREQYLRPGVGQKRGSAAVARAALRALLGDRRGARARALRAA